MEKLSDATTNNKKDHVENSTSIGNVPSSVEPTKDALQQPKPPETTAATSGPNEGDLVIRDGFPALYIPSSNYQQRLVQGDESIPRHAFWCHEDTIHFDPHHLATLRQDCETVFTARDKPEGAAYSAGQTFFLPATTKPRCALEALAMLIFRKHTEHLPEGTFHPANSGANWWTLVMNDDDGGDDDIQGKIGGGASAAAKTSSNGHAPMPAKKTRMRMVAKTKWLFILMPITSWKSKLPIYYCIPESAL